MSLKPLPKPREAYTTPETMLSDGKTSKQNRPGSEVRRFQRLRIEEGRGGGGRFGGFKMQRRSGGSDVCGGGGAKVLLETGAP